MRTLSTLSMRCLAAAPLVFTGSLLAVPMPITDFSNFTESGNMLNSASHDREQDFTVSGGQIDVTHNSIATGSAGQEIFGSSEFTSFTTDEQRFQVLFTDWNGQGGSNERIGLVVASAVPAGGPASADVRSSGDYFYWVVRNNNLFEAGMFTAAGIEETASTAASLTGPLVADGSGNHKITGLYMERNGGAWDLGYIDITGADVFVETRTAINGETITTDGSVIGLYSDMRNDASSFTFDDMRYGDTLGQDDDNDGLDDLWEDEHFGNNNGAIEASDLIAARGTQGQPASMGADWDNDSDGADNSQEQTAGTDPNVADTDMDGLDDGPEINGTVNPYDEFGYAGVGFGSPTDPLDTDSDDDGILDGEEVIAGVDGFETDPNLNDSDEDFLLDKWEIDNGLSPIDDGSINIITFDPGDFDNGDLGDPDGDSLDNFNEQQLGTHPNLADTDSDTVSDSDELDGAVNPWSGGVDTNTTPGEPTDPLVADSDADSLSDGEEVIVDSDPNNPDTDGDSFPDGLEVANSSDPLDENDTPAGFISVAASGTPVTISGASSDGSGLLVESTSFDMNGGNAVALLVTAENIGNNSALPIATFAGQPMMEVHAQDPAAGAQTASIFYLVDPVTTVGTFRISMDPGVSDIQLAYTPIALGNVPAFSTSAIASSDSDEAGAPLNLSYTTTTDDGFVLGAAVNNDYNNARKLQISTGNPSEDLLPHTLVGSSGHFHTSGRTGIAGGQTDGYLGQYQRTAIATVIFGAAPLLNDSDNDGLDDFWEDEHFGDNSGTVEPSDLTAARGTQAQDPGLGADWDNDSDNADNSQEQAAGSDPNVADTDGEGLDDGEEINTHGTSPVLADTEGDGLDDQEEVTAGADGFITNPLTNDTDGDMLLDKWEVDNLLDPTVDTGDDGKTGNPDSDGLDNLGEQTAGTNPQVADTDNDGANDGDEVNIYGTNPLIADTDGDGVSDGDEVGSANGSVTNPLSQDTDGDSFGDGVEITAGSDPDDDLDVPVGFITVVNTTTTATVDNGGPTVGADGLLFTSDSFDMGAGANAVVLIVTTEGAGNSSIHTARFAGEEMEEIYVEDPGAGVQTAAIYYIIDPASTTGAFEFELDADFGETVDYAYTAMSLANVTSIAGSDTARSTASTPAVPLELGYATGTDDGYVISAAVNNDFDGSRVLSVASGNPDTDLLPHTVVDTSGHFHTSGRVGPAGEFTDAYLGQYQRTAIATLVFGVTPAPPTEPSFVSAAFNGASFEMIWSNLDTGTAYQLERSSPGLDDFQPVGSPVTPAAETETFSDPNPPVDKAFYRLNDAP